ncbi:MAG: hypothetical protein K8F25_11985, partial [Fimbriimonadaceae bacterium]|nr:hypothetical protein [Alphaproteobacteria bacterium]
VELVADKSTKRSFDLKQLVGAKTVQFAQDEGVILRAMGDSVGLCPPLIIKEDEINRMFDMLERALDRAEAWIVKEDLRNA